jgi:hypothetical protein
MRGFDGAGVARHRFPVELAEREVPGKLELDLHGPRRNVHRLVESTNIRCASLAWSRYTYAPRPASVLARAAIEGGATHGTELLFVCSLGIGVTSVLTGLGVSVLVRLLRRLGRLVRGLEIASGVFLLVAGVFNFADSPTMVSAWLPFLNQFAR